MNSYIKKHKKKLIFLLFLPILLGIFAVSFKIIQYKTYIWLPNYLISFQHNKLDSLKDGHVIFLVVDHHEPGHGKRGIKKSKAWLKAYKNNVDGIYDDYGNPVQYTWFYPYDHLNSQVVLNLNALVFDGLGEVEFHWHHGPHTNESFAQDIETALSWFNSHGTMLPVGDDSKPQFGFVHGNWALDNSSLPKYCGVNRELDILQRFGCYADFTFTTFGTKAQPSKINSIYYAVDTDQPKSYNSGADARLGVHYNGLMIFEGPVCNDWHDLIWECAALETTSPFKPHRVNLWLKNAPTVKGRPEWLFVKVYTHGSQSRDVILGSQFRDMFAELKRISKEKGLSLHFVTAREAYNIVKAAEDGQIGNPENYRDYSLKKPINRVMTVKSMIQNITIHDKRVEFELVSPKKTFLSLKIGPVKTIDGFIEKYTGYRDENNDWHVNVHGDGTVRITSNEVVKFNNNLLSQSQNGNGEYEYLVEAN